MGGDAAVLLELIEELIHQVPVSIQMPVVFKLVLASALGRDRNALASFLQGLNDPLLCILGFVGNDNVGWYACQQGIGFFQIRGLTSSQMKAGWIA